MQRDSHLAVVDRSEWSDKKVRTQSPTARHKKADVWQITKLTVCTFLTYGDIAQTELLLRDSRQSNHQRRQGVEGQKKYEQFIELKKYYRLLKHYVEVGGKMMLVLLFDGKNHISHETFTADRSRYFHQKTDGY